MNFISKEIEDIDHKCHLQASISLSNISIKIQKLQALKSSTYEEFIHGTRSKYLSPLQTNFLHN